MRIKLLPILFLGIFFAFASADAQLLSGVAGSCATAINNQSTAGEDYCNAQKKCSKNDLITKFIPTECKKYGLGNITLGNWEKNEDAANVVKHFQNEGWLSDVLPATEAECMDPRPYIKLQDCKSSAEVSLGIRKVKGVDTCCALQVSTNIEKAREEKLAQLLCSGTYSYTKGIGPETKITDSYDIKKGINLSWPKSPIGTNLMEEKDGRIVPITIPKLIQYIYEWLISLGGFAAFIALVIAGVQYLTSAGNPGKMSEAISRIRSAGIGLVLLLSSVLILNTINPLLINLGIDPGKLQNAPAPIFKEGSSGSDCGIPCLAVEFCTEPNFNGSCEKINLGEGITKRGELPDIKKVRSVQFSPKEPISGDCSVTMYQLPLTRPISDEKPPFPLTIPAGDIGGEQGGFPMKSYEASDVSGVSGFKF